jgi:hypothetical protein
MPLPPEENVTMTSVPRLLAVVLSTGLALAAVGCGSNNKGKIVGKWRLDSGGGMTEPVLKQLAEQEGYAFFEFKDDGTMTMGFGSTDPQKQEALDKLTLGSCKYKLGTGDAVELYDLSKSMRDDEGGSPFGKEDRAKGAIKIDGDTMTLVVGANSEDLLKLTRLK